MSNKWKPSNRGKRRPFEYTKKFRKAITQIDNQLKPGILVKTRHRGVILLYIGHDKNQKTWHRKYYFLSEGKLQHMRRSSLYLVELL